MNRNKFAVLIMPLSVLCAGLLIIGCGKTQETDQAASQPETTEAQTQTQTAPAATTADAGIPQVGGDTVTTASGLKYIDITVGDGAAPDPGSIIAAHYTGWLTDGTKFDSSRDRGQPLEFPIGQGRVIRGWDEGLLSMKVGGHRMLIIPPELGYGDRGTPGGPIPPRATLIFDVELVGINTPATP